MTGVALRNVALLILVGVVGMALLTARATLTGRDELALSDAAFDAGDVLVSLSHARKAAAHYAPGAPHVRPAYERMTAIARGAEREGNTALAERAWADVRGAALETRHVLVPAPKALSEANRNLERLARLKAPVEATEGDVPAATGARETLYESTDRPGVAAAYWGLALFLGFCLMIAGLGLCVARGVRPDGKISAPSVRIGALLVLAGAGCWTVVVLWA